jgi:uncharacterized protein YegL
VNAAKSLIEKRLNADNSSAFSVVRFSENAEKLTDFISYQEELSNALDTLEIKGSSALGKGLALAIKIIIDELRKIMAKPPRILVISDGNYTKSAIDPIKMARLAQGLGIKIDTFRIGDISQLNILKRLSDLTGGIYYYNNSENSLLDSAKRFADSNIKAASAKKEKIVDSPQFLRKIAANLLRVQDLTKNQEIKIKQLRGEADYKKCTICFSEVDPYTKGSFFLTGRYCPNCNAPFHVHCLSTWASSQTESTLLESGTVRCPHCFYLLKIPTEVSQAQKLRSLTRTSTPLRNETKAPEIIPAELTNVSAIGEEALYKSCPVCHLIFEEDQEVIRCSECNTLYHVECFKRLHDSHCKTCSKKLHLY